MKQSLSIFFHLQVPSKSASIKIGEIIKKLRYSELLKNHKPLCDSDGHGRLCPQKIYAFIYQFDIILENQPHLRPKPIHGEMIETPF